MSYRFWFREPMNKRNNYLFTEQISQSKTNTSSFLLSSFAHSFPEEFKYLHQPKRSQLEKNDVTELHKGNTLFKHKEKNH